MSKKQRFQKFKLHLYGRKFTFAFKKITMLDFSKILFLDIETVPKHSQFSDVPEIEQELFADKTKYQRNVGTDKEISSETFYQKAGIWAEFGKIICISIGYIRNENDQKSFRIKSFYAADESELLMDFKNILEKHFLNYRLCAHNGKEFDFPFIARRMLINKIPLPKSLELRGKKPWEIPHLDTLELWKFGDYKHFTSLKLLCYLLDVPSPKQEIDGSQIYEYYYQKKDMDSIVAYCERDTLAVAQVLLAMHCQPLIEMQRVTFSVQ